MAVLVRVPEARRPALREALIKLLPLRVCDLCKGELDEHDWFVVKAAGTPDAKVVRCSIEEGPVPPRGRNRSVQEQNGNSTSIPASRKAVPADQRCVHRSGCKDRATVQVVGRTHIRYCQPHGAEFAARQALVVEGKFELEPLAN